MNRHTLPVVAALGFIAASLVLPSHLSQPTGRVIDVNARDYFFEAPDTLDAGVVTFRLWQRGDDFHNLEIVRIDSGHTLNDWHRAAVAHELPEWASNRGGPGFAQPRGSSNATLVLEPGTYLLTCSVGSARTVDSLYHVWRGMVRPLHVRARRQPGSLPRPDIMARITDSGVEFSGAMRAGPRVLRVENAGTVVHEFNVSRVLPGHTAAEAIAWRRRMGTPAPDTLVGGLADMAPGLTLFTTIVFEAAEHVATTLPGAGKPGARTVFRIGP
jgi:hypothetical protein